MKKTLRVLLIKILQILLFGFDALYILLRIKKIYKNDKILLFKNPSFGHQAIIYDWFNFLEGRKILFEMSYTQNNSFLKTILLKDVLTFEVAKFEKTSVFIEIFLSSRYKNLKFILKKISNKLNFDFLTVEKLYGLNEYYEKKEPIFKYFSENENKFLIYENNFNYKKICREKLEKNFLHSPKQLENLRDKIKEIKETFFQKKIIAFHIRNKFNSQYSFDSEARDTKLNDDLSKFIHMLIEEEFNLFLIGDLENIRIKNKNIFTSEEFHIEKKLMDIAAIYFSDFFIGPHSGPLHLAGIFGVPSFVINCYPFWQSTFNEKDFLLHPKVFFKNNKNNEIPLMELYQSNSPLIYGKDFKEYSLVDNDFDTLKEAWREFSDPLEKSRLNDLNKKFYENIPPDIPLKYLQARIFSKNLNTK